MNIGNSYHSMFYANNTTNTQSSSTTNNVSQNSFLAQLEKVQETSQVEQTQETQNIPEKKDYSSMSLEELNNLSYEEYKTYGEEIWERADEIYFPSSDNTQISDARASVVAKVQLADYTYDDNTNKALMKSLEEYNGNPLLFIMVDLDVGVRDHMTIEDTHSYNENGTQEFLNLTKEQRTAALSIDGASKVVGYYKDSLKAGQTEFGTELSPHIQSGYNMWSSILENLIKQIDIEVYV